MWTLLRPAGTRSISSCFHFGHTWSCDATSSAKLPDSAEDSGGDSACASRAHPRTNYAAGCRCPSATHHGMMVVVVVSCVAVLVLTSCGILSTWHRFCVLRPSVPKCPPASVVTGSINLSLAVFSGFSGFFWIFPARKSSKLPRQFQLIRAERSSNGS